MKKDMKRINNFVKVMLLSTAIIMPLSCSDILDEPQENTVITDDTDYTDTDKMISFLYGAYAKFETNEWESGLLLAVRGDDVNAGGLGDQSRQIRGRQ